MKEETHVRHRNPNLIKGKRIQIGAYAKSRVYVRISSYSSAYKMSEEDFEQPYYENHMN